MVITIICLVMIMGGAFLLNAKYKTDYQIIKNPYKNQAVNYRQAKYLKILVKRPRHQDTKIRILLKLFELFEDEEIEFEDSKKIKLKEVIADLRAKGRTYMAEFYNQNEDERTWVWFEK